MTAPNAKSEGEDEQSSSQATATSSAETVQEENPTTAEAILNAKATQVIFDAINTLDKRAGTSYNAIEKYLAEYNLYTAEPISLINILNAAVASGNIILTNLGCYKLSPELKLELMGPTLIHANHSNNGACHACLDDMATDESVLQMTEMCSNGIDTSDYDMQSDDSSELSSDESDESFESDEDAPSHEEKYPIFLSKFQPNIVNPLVSLDRFNLFIIFDSLTLDDICNVAVTCCRLYEIVLKYIHRRYPRAAAEIDAPDYMVRFDDAPKHVQTFYAKPNIVLGDALSNPKTMELLGASYRIQGKAIENVQFEGIRELRAEYCKPLESFLNNINTAIFSSVRTIGGFNEVIPPNCSSQMKELILIKDIQMECLVKRSWMVERYSNLEHFCWFLDREFFASTKFLIFLINNPNLSRFSLLSENVNTVKDCLRRRYRITDLYFKIGDEPESDLMELDNIRDRLCCVPLRLHLLIGDNQRSKLMECAEDLIELRENIVGLYFEAKRICNEMAHMLNELPNLKYLQISRCDDARQLTLTSLEEVYMSVSVTDLKSTFIRDTMMAMVSTSPQLKKMYFRNNEVPLNFFRFDEYDRLRREHTEIEPLTVYLVTDEEERIAEFHASKQKYDTFTIKRTEMSFVTNPLVHIA